MADSLQPFLSLSSFGFTSVHTHSVDTSVLFGYPVNVRPRDLCPIPYDSSLLPVRVSTPFLNNSLPLALTIPFCFRPENPIERALVYPVIGTFVGAWIGAIPIALDWDRPWQSYPLTVAFASILGFIVGGFASWTHSVGEDMYEEVSAEGNVKENEKMGKKKKNKKKKSIAA